MKSLTIEELLEDFADFDDWRDRYRYIIELGKELDELPEELRTEENRVQGCVSNLWLVMDVQPGTPPLIHFRAASDAPLVRGLVSIVAMLCWGRPAKEIVAMDIENDFRRLDLGKHVTHARSNGLHYLIQQIRTLAGQYACAG